MGCYPAVIPLFCRWRSRRNSRIPAGKERSDADKFLHIQTTQRGPRDRESGVGRRVCQRTLGGSITIGDYPPPRHRTSASMNEDVLESLERRLGRLHARQRIGIEDDHEARVFGRGLNYFHPENWYYNPTIIRNALKLTGLYWRARKNAERIQIRHNDIMLPG